MMPPERRSPLPLVLDTNVVLDLLVFFDAAAQPLQTALVTREAHWLATRAMRDEFERVLGYTTIAARLASSATSVADVLAAFDEAARMVDAPVKAPVTCSDPDDQKFIDLAVHHRCHLLSKDSAVLALRKRLAAHQVSVVPALPPASSYSLIGA